MSPIDDELRAALRGRASAVQPSPDPLAGIEQRAGRLRRNRVGAAVAGSALAVAVVAAVVPAVQSATTATRSQVPSVASAAPAPTASYALDPTDPWAFRGTPVDEGTRATIQREYATFVRGSEVRVTPLFAQVYEPSQLLEVVFLAEVDGGYRWGVAQEGHAGPELTWDAALEPRQAALAAALPGDEVARLLVVTAPEAESIAYVASRSANVASTRSMAELAPGVATGPLEGDPATDGYEVRWPGGGVLTGDAPDLRGEPTPGDQVPAPANAVAWPTRGGLSAELQEQALTEFAQAAGASRDEVGSRLLFAGQRGDRVYVLLQAWAGGDARAFGWFYDTEDRTTGSVLHGPTAPGPAAIAVSLDGVLMVVPEPAAGQVLYARDGRSEPQPVPDQGTEAAVLIDRPETTTGDLLLILDGDGDPDRPLYRGTVQALLDVDE